MTKTTVSGIIGNALEDFRYRGKVPTKIVLSESMHEKLEVEMSTKSKLSDTKITTFLGYPIEIRGVDSLKITVE